MIQSAPLSRDRVRLLFEIERDDNPRLYDDLVRFNKGTKRVNRLRLLAHEGLVALQSVTARPVGSAQIEAWVGVPNHADLQVAAGRHTNQVFGVPTVGDEI